MRTDLVQPYTTPQGKRARALGDMRQTLLRADWQQEQDGSYGIDLAQFEALKKPEVRVYGRITLAREALGAFNVPDSAVLTDPDPRREKVRLSKEMFEQRLAPVREAVNSGKVTLAFDGKGRG